MRRWWIACVLSVGCGGSDHHDSDDRMDGHAYLSAVAGATVQCHAVQADGSLGPVVASATCDSAGRFSISLPSSAPYVLVCSGGQYVEEYGGAVVTATTMMCGVSTGARYAALTPFTTMACRLALNAGGYTAENLAAAAQTMSGYCGFDVVGTAPANVLQSMGMMMSGAQMGMDYGLLLGAMSQVADSLGVNSCQLMAMALEDLEDGDFDGTGASGPVLNPVTGMPMDPATMTTMMSNAVGTFAVSGWNVCGGAPSGSMMAAVAGGI